MSMPVYNLNKTAPARRWRSLILWMLCNLKTNRWTLQRWLNWGCCKQPMQEKVEPVANGTVSLNSKGQNKQFTRVKEDYNNNFVSFWNVSLISHQVCQWVTLFWSYHSLEAYHRVRNESLFNFISNLSVGHAVFWSNRSLEAYHRVRNESLFYHSVEAYHRARNENLFNFISSLSVGHAVFEVTIAWRHIIGLGTNVSLISYQICQWVTLFLKLP